MTRGDRVRWLLRGLGQTLVTAGVVVLLFCVYELQVTGLYTAEQQKSLGRDLSQEWAAPAPSRPPVTPGQPQLAAFEPGKGIARLYLPTLGRDQVKVVVEGVSRKPQAGPAQLVWSIWPNWPVLSSPVNVGFI